MLNINKIEKLENGTNERKRDTHTVEKIKLAVAIQQFHGQKIGRDVAKLKDERQKKYELSKKSEIDRDFLIPETSVFQSFKMERRTKKEHNRTGYEQRIANRKIEVVKTDYDILQEARRRVCPCGYRYNIYERVNGLYFCNHKTSEIDGSLSLKSCANCGNTVCYEARSQCGCKYALCRRCHFSTYYDNPKNAKLLFDSHPPMMRIKTEKTIEATPVVAKVSYADMTKRTDTEYKVEDALKQRRKYIPKEKRRSFFSRLELQAAPLLEAKEQGAMVSTTKTAGDTVVGAFGTLKDTIVKAIMSIKDKIAEKIGHAVLETAFNTPRLKPLTDILEIINDFLHMVYSICGTFLDYLMEPTICFDLIEFIHTICTGGWKSNVVRMARLFLSFVEAERKARLSIVEGLVNAVTQNQCRMKYIHELAKNRKFGVLSTLVREKIAGLHPGQVVDFLRSNANSFGIFGSHEQCGFTEDFAGFCEAIKQMFPRFNGNTFKLFSEFARAVGPIISTANGASRLGKDIWSAVKAAISNFSDSFMTNEQWLEVEIYREESPIHKLLSAQIAYRETTITAKGKDAVAMREEFYKLKAEAEAYVARKKRISKRWFTFISDLEKGMIEPPAPSKRDFEPTVLCLYGPPGVGKSQIWPILMTQVLDMATEEEVREATYTWKTDSEFTPGLAAAKVVLFDDFGQDRETSDEALAIIGLCTTAPYMTNSPNIVGRDIKGMFATPQAVIVCTNDHTMNSDKLADPRAITRRMDLFLEVLDRANFEDNAAGEKLIFRIKACNQYKQLEGKAVSLQTATTLMGLIHHNKRLAYTKVQEQTSDKFKDLKNSFKVNVFSTNAVAAKGELYSVEGPFNEEYKRYIEAKLKSMDFAREQGNNTHTELKLREISDVLKGVGVITGTIVGVRLVAETLNVFANKGIIHGFNGTYREVLMGIKTIIIQASAAIAIFYGTYKGLDYMFQEQTTQEQSGTQRTSKAHAKRIIVPIADAREQGVLEQLTPSIEKAMAVIRREDGFAVNGVFIGETYLLTVNHLFQDYNNSDKIISEGTELQIRKYGTDLIKKCYFEKERYFPVDYDHGEPGCRTDVAIYRLDPKIFSMQKNIIDFFWDGDHHVTNYKVTKIDFTIRPHDVIRTSIGTVSKDCTRSARRKGNDVYYHIMGQANYEERDGSCGSLILNNQSKDHRCILGIHGAVLNTGDCQFSYVTRQMIRDTIKRSDLIVFEQGNYSEVIGKPNYLPEVSKLEHLGQLERAVYQNTKTDLTPSLVYEFDGPHKTEPSALHFKDKRLPDRNLIPRLFEGYSIISEFQPEEVHEAYLSVLEDTRKMNAATRVPQRPLDDYEVLNGFQWMQGNTKIPMNTSCGYPYVMEGLKKDDLLYEQPGMNMLVMKDRLREDWKRTVNNVQKGIVPYLPFILSIKDERLKLKKIYEEPKSRLFANGSLLHFMLSRKYFFTHMLAQYNDSKDTYSTIGVDRISLDWHDLMMYLTEVGDRGFDGDYKNWDRSISRTLLFYMFEVMIDGVRGSMTELEVDALRELMISPIYIYGYDVFRADGTMPSGALFTYNGNNHINEIIHRSAYLAIMRKNSPLLGSIREYRLRTRGKRGGDDTVQVCDEEVLKSFNFETFGEWLREHGMVYTAGDKGEETEKHKPYTELTFLKNKSRIDDGFILPLGDWDSLIEMTYWVRINKENSDIRKATEDNVNAALRGIYFYGERIFDQTRTKILSHEPTLNLYTYKDLNAIWDNYYHFPGSHSDFSTRIDQEDDTPLLARPKEAKHPKLQNHTPKYM